MRRLAVVFALLVAGCGGSPTPVVTDAWARPLPPSVDSLAFYIEVEGGDGDRIVAMSSPICRVSELHDTTLEDSVMRMRLIDLPYEVDGGLEMDPAGMHVMCIDPTVSPQLGDTVEVTLTFEKYGDLVAIVQIEDR